MMETLTDLIFRYCVIFGKRFFAKEKIAFLRIISKELIQLGYGVDAKLAQQQLTKKRHQNYYNAYIGNIDKADLIICTHYDTGINYFNLSKTHAFEQNFSKVRYFIGLLPVFILFALSVILNYLVFLPNIQEVGFFSVSGVLAILSTVVFFYFILRYRNGVPNHKNFVYNTSSIIVMINLIKKLDKKTKKKIAFVLLDGGCTSQFGLKMLESYSNTILSKKIIFLDSLGNGDQLQYLKPSHVKCDIDTITFHTGAIDTAFNDYLLISAGQLDNNNKIIIKNAHSRKDNTLPLERVEQHTQSLHQLCTNIILATPKS